MNPHPPPTPHQHPSWANENHYDTKVTKEHLSHTHSIVNWLTSRRHERDR